MPKPKPAAARRVKSPTTPPKFQMKVYTPAKCRCCGVQHNPSQKAMVGTTIDAALLAYQKKVGGPAADREIKRQGEALLATYLAEKAKEPLTGDAKILELLSEARRLYTAANRMRPRTKKREAMQEQKWEAGRQAINGAVETWASGAAGVFSKLDFVAGQFVKLYWHGDYAVDEMLLSARKDLRALLHKTGAK